MQCEYDGIFDDINEAYDACGDGDRICIKSGVYRFNPDDGQIYKKINRSVQFIGMDGNCHIGCRLLVESTDNVLFENINFI